ncbi:alpha-N-acetylgalactosaminide alpha-2,6-sialyltransferase 2-like [Tachysurus fulvidraco]|uniref:alpha-N-acetylgalactosaminide alpha-2,6-sialyltransferase 2-like n=1 Tax=Tachysurus fulvidraco TaxID=1234273 RepID=UPI001FED5B15|nr:alpha-N-acetylgalactosaminide alpha-2,6-sialyltransferase 2-like [Tachysurus fulvidraco]
MIFLRRKYQKKLVLIILILCFMVGIYLLDLNIDQRRLQVIKIYWENYHWNDMWSFKLALFNKGKKIIQIKDQFTNNDTIVRVYSNEDKMVEQTGNSPLKPVKSDQLSELGFFGDEYAVNDDMPQTNCPSSIQKKVLQTDFAKIFLPSVPVLQWAKHYTKPEYKRLSHYHGAHGWGSVSADVLNESLAILNTSANRLMFDDREKRENKSQCIRCAVVGNAGILNGSKKGHEIDQNDYVFRTNGAVIKGFEADVGSRTSFYTFSTNTLRNSLRSYAHMGYKHAPQSTETRYIFLPDHDRDYILMRAASLQIPIPKGKDRSSTPPNYFGPDVTVDKFKMYHPDFIRYLRNRFLHSSRLNGRLKNIYRPSTGAVMLLAALHKCDEVNAYGFMTPDFRKYSDHYYDKKPQRVHFFANHDLRMELNLWQKLHKAGLIKLYMRT